MTTPLYENPSEPRLRSPLRARLLGCRWVERGDRYGILRMPWWFPRSLREQALRRVAADFRIKYRRPLHYQVGDTLVRVWWRDAT